MTYVFIITLINLKYKNKISKVYSNFSGNLQILQIDHSQAQFENQT